MAAYAHEERARSHQFGVDIWFLLLQNVGGRVTRQLGPSLTLTKEVIVKSVGEF